MHHLLNDQICTMVISCHKLDDQVYGIERVVIYRQSLIVSWLSRHLSVNMHQNLTANTILNNYISILCQYFVNTFLFFCYIKWKLKLCFFNFNFVSFFYWSKESNITDNLGCRPTFGIMILRKENVQKSCSCYCLDKTDFYGGFIKAVQKKDRPYCYQLFFCGSHVLFVQTSK